MRLSLGGIRDEAEIRGHRRTYIGSLPGRIIQGLRNAGSNNPLFILDEVDKLGADFRGDPASALLEVLDPEQNNTFVDHYLDVPFDLSKVLFLTTANMLDPIPHALRDRMEVLELPGYTEEEKLQIVAAPSDPEAADRERTRRSEDRILATTRCAEIIRSYTREAGLRNLEREIARVCRKIARSITEGETAPSSHRRRCVQKYLGAPKFFSEVAERTQEPGVATGLAWTPNGGDIMFIESTRMAGQKGLDADRLARRRDEGIGAGGAVLYPLARRSARNRAGLLRQVRHPRARAGGRDSQGRPVGRRDDRGLAGVAADADGRCAPTSR